jgi:hypothetical protein
MIEGRVGSKIKLRDGYWWNEYWLNAAMEESYSKNPYTEYPQRTIDSQIPSPTAPEHPPFL